MNLHLKHVVLGSVLSLAIHSSSFANEMRIDTMANRSFLSAMNMSDEHKLDFNTYLKLANNNFADYDLVLDFKRIDTEHGKFLVFKGKSKDASLFITNENGDALLKVGEWGTIDKITHPFMGNENFFSVDSMYINNKPGEEQTKKLYVFEAEENGNIKNVLNFVESSEYCIINPMLPIDVKNELDEERKFYTACSGKADVVTFSNTGAKIKFTYKLDQDFLSNAQYKKLLNKFSFNNNGELTYNWDFKRSGIGEQFQLTSGNTTHPILNKDNKVKLLSN